MYTYQQPHVVKDHYLPVLHFLSMTWLNADNIDNAYLHLCLSYVKRTYT